MMHPPAVHELSVTSIPGQPDMLLHASPVGITNLLTSLLNT